MREAAIYERVKRLTRKAFGCIVNPHLFRDSAATAFAQEDPAHVRASAALLGHGNLATTERYYNHAAMLTAVRRHGETIAALRAGTRSGKRKKAP